MDSWVKSALKSILRGDPIRDSAAWFFVIILKYIFTSIFEIKIHEKKFLDIKKNFIFEGRFLITIIFPAKENSNRQSRTIGLVVRSLGYSGMIIKGTK